MWRFGVLIKPISAGRARAPLPPFKIPQALLARGYPTFCFTPLVIPRGGYFAESFKSGFDSVSTQQFEAGLSLGLSNKQNFLYILLPQSLGVAMPSISANLIFLFKETSVVSIIALPDLVHTMSALNAITYKTDELLLMLFLAYLFIILPMSLFLGFLEKKFRHA